MMGSDSEKPVLIGASYSFKEKYFGFILTCIALNNIEHFTTET